MQQYTCLLIDDEKSNLDLIKHFIINFIPNLKIIGEVSNVEDGIKLIKKMKPDILFLDIQLNDKNAFDILDKLNFLDFQIIFVTAYKEYAVKAFKYNVVDYVLKPVLIDDVQLAVDKCIRRIEEKRNFEKEVAFEEENDRNNSKYLYIPSLNKVDLIKTDEIVFCKSDGRYTSFYMKNKEEIVACKNLGQFEELLDKSVFFRIHHSYIINFKHLISISKKSGYHCEMINNVNLPVAKRRQESLCAFLKNKK